MGEELHDTNPGKYVMVITHTALGTKAKNK